MADCPTTNGSRRCPTSLRDFCRAVRPHQRIEAWAIEAWATSTAWMTQGRLSTRRWPVGTSTAQARTAKVRPAFSDCRERTCQHCPIARPIDASAVFDVGATMADSGGADRGRVNAPVAARSAQTPSATFVSRHSFMRAGQIPASSDAGHHASRAVTARGVTPAAANIAPRASRLPAGPASCPGSCPSSWA